MKGKRSVIRGFMVLIVAAIMAFAVTGVSAGERFGLKDIPPIKNKRPIHVAMFGGYAQLEKVIPPILQKFSEHTGVKVTNEKMVMTSIYPKINVELIAQTGAYDSILVEASTTNEWARYLWAMDDLAEKYDPKGKAGLQEVLAGIDKAQLACATDRKGRLMGVPYWNYTQINIYRKDVFDDPTEKANFKKKYGYDLAPAETRQQELDQAKFFTRKKGELLKGKPLKDDLYGVGLMAGRFEINDEFSSIIWGAGGHWMTLIRDKDGTPKEFVITKKDKKVLKEAMIYYKELLKYASPGCINTYWDFLVPQLQEGKVISLPYMYTGLDSWASQVEKTTPGARLGLAMCVGKQGYIGNFFRAIPLVTKNAEANYWLAKYLASYEVQKEIQESPVPGIRRDVLEDPKYQTEEWRNRVGRLAKICVKQWDYQYPFVKDYMWFNSTAGGKIYEQQIIILHDGATGKLTPDETVKKLTKTTLKLQRKFGELPVREEK